MRLLRSCAATGATVKHEMVMAAADYARQYLHADDTCRRFIGPSVSISMHRLCSRATLNLQSIIRRPLAAHTIGYNSHPLNTHSVQRHTSPASAAFRAADIREWAGLCTAYNRRCCEMPLQPSRPLITGDSFWNLFVVAMEASSQSPVTTTRPW